MSTDNTLYAALGVAVSAGADEIDAAYAARVQALSGDADALSLLRVARDTLRDPARRAAYDRQLAARPAAAEAPVFLAADYPAPRPSRSRLRNWLILFAAAGVTAAIFWPKKPAPGSVAVRPAAPAAVPAAVPAAANAPAPAPIPEPPPAAEAAAPGVAAPPADAPDPAPAGASASLAALPTRGAKQPGFDVQYVAWSVFTIRQRNLSGSGVLIGPERILTNCHVLAGGASNGLVVVHGLTKRVSKVEKYARLDGEDACLLYAPGAGSEAIAWGSAAALRPGDTVHALGHPGGSSEIAWSEGRFHLRAERGGETFLISDNYCRPGSSGGPLLDNEGRLVGIVTAVQRFQAKGGEPPQFGACISVTEATARALLAKPLFPIALAPAQYIANY
ncbi:MAG: trypsin-like peptidase domain-containing protein [Rhodocyclales bacterium]|nr:trypsin-like peptidase domain-containing protein [Rhodocyclales bacterium]